MLAGCTPVIIDRDFQKEEAQFIKKYGELAKDPLYAPSTESVIKLAEEDGIEITLYKEQPDLYEGMLLDNWVAVLKNKTSENLCVLTLWKLMDFQMEKINITKNALLCKTSPLKRNLQHKSKLYSSHHPYLIILLYKIMWFFHRYLNILTISLGKN